MNRPSQSLAGAVVAAILLLLFPAALGAHGAVVNASPEPAEASGGTVEEISIVFDDPVTDASMSIDGPDGATLEATFTHRRPTWLGLSIEPLTLEGRYIVRYQITTELGRDIDAAYWFDFDPSADAALAVDPNSVAPWPEDPTASRWLTLVLVVISTIGVGLFLNSTRTSSGDGNAEIGD